MEALGAAVNTSIKFPFSLIRLPQHIESISLCRNSGLRPSEDPSSDYCCSFDDDFRPTTDLHLLLDCKQSSLQILLSRFRAAEFGDDISINFDITTTASNLHLALMPLVRVRNEKLIKKTLCQSHAKVTIYTSNLFIDPYY